MRGAVVPRLLFVAFSAALAALAAAFVFRVVLASWNTGDTSVRGVRHARSSHPPPTGECRRLVFVVVDGLGFDAAIAEPELSSLADGGTLRPLRADFPTYTAPNITSMFTGVGPRDSGVRLNGAGDGASGLDSVLASAWDSGVYVRTRSRQFSPFLELARPPRASDARGGRLAVLTDLAIARASIPPTQTRTRAVEMEAIHFGEVDDVGHAHGAASEAYRSEVRHAALFLKNVASHLDSERDVLVAVSDHGHRAAGGHGGVEPEVEKAFFLAWGHDIRKGARLDERPLRDVASTLTVMLGVPTPSSNLGRPMLDVLDVSDETRARLLAEPYDEITRFSCAVSNEEACGDATGASLGLEAGKGLGPAEAELDAIAKAVDADLAMQSTSRRRLPLAVSFLLALVTLAVALRYRPRTKAGLAAPLALVLPYVAVLALEGYGPTLSAMTPLTIFAPDAGTGLAVSVGFIGAATYLGKLGLRDAVWMVLVTLALLLPLWGWAGADPRSTTQPTAGALTFEASPLIIGAAVGGWLMVAIEAARVRASRRATPGAVE